MHHDWIGAIAIHLPPENRDPQSYVENLLAANNPGLTEEADNQWALETIPQDQLWKKNKTRQKYVYFGHDTEGDTLYLLTPQARRFLQSSVLSDTNQNANLENKREEKSPPAEVKPGYTIYKMTVERYNTMIGQTWIPSVAHFNSHWPRVALALGLADATWQGMCFFSTYCMADAIGASTANLICNLVAPVVIAIVACAANKTLQKHYFKQIHEREPNEGELKLLAEGNRRLFAKVFFAVGLWELAQTVVARVLVSALGFNPSDLHDPTAATIFAIMTGVFEGAGIFVGALLAGDPTHDSQQFKLLLKVCLAGVITGAFWYIASVWDLGIGNAGNSIVATFTTLFVVSAVFTLAMNSGKPLSLSTPSHSGPLFGSGKTYQRLRQDSSEESKGEEKNHEEKTPILNQ